MRVLELWRYPVKSLLGERLRAVRVSSDGLDGDRAWGILDLATGRILTGRREPRLLFASARLSDAGEPCITLPSGEVHTGLGPEVDVALSSWLGKPVQLVAAAESSAARAEYFADATDDASQPIEWTMPQGRFVDAMPILVITTAGIRAGHAAYPAGNWDVRRFRPNVLVEADGESWIEDAWCGRSVQLGEVEVIPRKPCPRCTMVNRAQPEIAKDVEIYKTLSRTHGGTGGVWSAVAREGTVQEGDFVTLRS